MSSLVNGRSDDVRRRLAGKLDDVLAEISLERFNAFGLERGVQMNLFRRHALALDDESRTALARQSLDDVVRFGRVTGPMNLSTGSFGIRGELLEIPVEIK